MKSAMIAWLRQHPVLLVVLAHILVFVLLAGLAMLFSQAYPDLSPSGSHLRLVPLHVR